MENNLHIAPTTFPMGEILRFSEERARELLAKPPMTTIRWGLFEFAVKGLSPLLFDRMTKEEIRAIKTKQKVVYQPGEPFEDAARRKLYSDTYDTEELTRWPTGICVIPGDNLFASLRDAGTDVQYGSGQYDKVTLASKGTMFSWMVRFHQPYFQVLGMDGKPANWVTDVRKGNATQGTGACCIIRPRFDEWGFVGHLELNVDMLSVDNLNKLFTVAGMKCGLCSARPGKKMNFGTFTLTHLQWLSGAEPRSTAPETAAAPKRSGGRKKAAAPTVAAPAEAGPEPTEDGSAPV